MDYDELNSFSENGPNFNKSRSRTLGDFLFWIRNRSWLIALLTVAGLILGYYVHANTPKTYVAKSTIEIEREEKAEDIDNKDSSKAVKLGGSSVIATATDKLLMRKHFIKMVENTELHKNPNVRKKTFSLMPTGDEAIENKEIPIDKVAQMARGWVKPQARKNSYLIDITVEHTDPEISMLVAISLLTAYQENLENEVKSESSNNVKIVQSLVEDAEDQLLKLSERLALYNACLQSQENIRMAGLEILELEKRYGPKWPSMIEANTKLKTLKETFDKELQQVLTISTDEKKYWDSLPQGIDKIQNVEARAHFLTTEVTNRQLLRDKMISKIDDEEIGTKVTREFKIQSKALLPTQPNFINPLTTIGKYLAGGLLSGLLIVLAIGFLDPSIRSVQELEQIYEIPVLGAIPIHSKSASEYKVKRKKDKKVRPVQPILTDRSPTAEAIRNLRAGLTFLGEKKDRRSFLVTSAVPGEGKSFVSSNIAGSFATQGDKTLLVDLDLRRPVQQRIFEQDRSPGVSDFIVKGGDINDYIKETEIDSLNLMTAGTQSPHPSELMSYKNISKLLNNIPSEYDRIVIDSAPVLAIRDSLAPAKLVDSTVVVYKMGSTHLRALSRLLKIYDEYNSYPVGLIANSLPQVKSSGGYHGYYGNYYYGSYQYGYMGGAGAYYGEEEEDPNNT